LRIIERAELDKLNARLIRIGLVDRGGAKRRGWGYSLRLGLIDPLILHFDGQARQVSDALDRYGLIHSLITDIGQNLPDPLPKSQSTGWMPA
jgi:hypothetical protein